MRRWILLAVIGLTLSCVVGAVLALGGLQGGLSIHAIPVYPGATNVQVQDWGSSSGGQSQGGGVIVRQSGSGQGSSYSFSQSYYSRTPGGGTMDFSTNDSPQQVYAFYDKRLAQAGWTSNSTRGGLFAPTGPTGWGTGTGQT